MTPDEERAHDIEQLRALDAEIVAYIERFIVPCMDHEHYIIGTLRLPILCLPLICVTKVISMSRS